MMAAVAYVIIKENLQDQAFLDKYTVGFDKFKEYVTGVEDGVEKTPAWAEAICGVPAQTITELARRYATNQEDLGTLGNVHHGIGSSYAIGGKIKAPCHIDATYRDAVVELDGRVVMDCGKILV